MRSALRRKVGFSLIELMVAVAIIGTLASMAIPSFQRMQLRTRAAEGRTNLASLRTSQEGYFAEFGTYVGAAPTPPAIPSGGRVPWPGSPGFDTVGWLPDGAIQFQYAVTIPGGAGGVWSYTAEAASDLDEDGRTNVWGYVKQDAAGVGVVGVLGCQDTGVWDAFTGTPTITEIVGPCDAVSGQSVF
jgi:prepilin-type N-terminal cleavage/methylation domain-containing protein